MSEEPKRRDALIIAPSADALDFVRNPKRLDTVVRIRDLESDLKRLPPDPDALHVCPFCNEHLTWVVFKAHMPECIALRGRDVPGEWKGSSQT